MENTIASIITAILLSLGLFGGLWAILRVRPRLPRWGIVLVLAAGALLRLYLMQACEGHEYDMASFYSWGLRMAENGPVGFYAPDYFCDYPPGYLWLLWLPGKLTQLFELSLTSAGGLIVVKLVPVLFDLAAVYLIWRVARKALDDTTALVLAGLYAFSPAILMDSAIWGQTDAVLALGLALALLFVMQGRWQAALPVYILTVLIKPQALLAGPLGLAALAVDLLSGGEKRRKTLKLAGIGLLAGLAAAFAVLFPFLRGEAAPLTWLIEKYVDTMSYYSYASVNALNLHYLLGNNWVPLSGAYGAAGTALTVLAALAAPAIHLWRRESRNLPMLAALTYLLVYLLGTGMHERYVYPAFLLLILACIQRQDSRIPILFCGTGVLFFINCALLLRDLHLPLGFWGPGAVLSLLYLGLGGLALWLALDRKTRHIPGVMKSRTRKAKSPPGTTPPLEIRLPHLLILAALTAAYGALAFYNLGSTKAPQTVWHAAENDAVLVFDTGTDAAYNILTYQEITRFETAYTIEVSFDGVSYSTPLALVAGPGDCFQWQMITEGTTGRYVRLTAQAGLSLGEIVFQSAEDGLALNAVLAAGEGSALLDESGTAPDTPSYYNSAYFDEIYHARTGYEYANGIAPYETTHPPLGKVFIMLGIRLFGMTPFGWRFSGTLAGVLMLPAMYALGLVVFRKGKWGLLAAFLLAVDLLHLTQTRIATIDSYPVLFIILAYAAMFRFAQMSVWRDGWRVLLPLGLSGLFIALAIASKWIGLYAAAGLAAVFFHTLYRSRRESRAQAAPARAFRRYAWGQVLFCVAAFGLLPLAVYYFSYLPHLAPSGGLNPADFWQAQSTMLNYHANLQGEHAFASPWYEWPLSLKPLFMYNTSHPAPGQVSAINAFGNLVVWWGGFAGLCWLLWAWYAPRARLKGPLAANGGALGPGYILIGFASQFLPWMLVSRLTFIYHYFASLIFAILAIVYVFVWLWEKHPGAAKVAVCAYAAAALVLFVLHYPLASALTVSREYADSVNFLQQMQLPGWSYPGWLWY